MKSIHLLVATVVIAGIAQVGEAGLFDRVICRKAGKRCDCDCVPTYQPACCKPVIVAPRCKTVHTYQRRCSTLKPPCCHNGCGPAVCCAPACPMDGCTAGNGCCAAGSNCACDACSGFGCDCGAGMCGNGCCDTSCCDTGCCDIGSSCDGCCPGANCDLAQLIYESQTGCYARHRKRAVHRLSDRYDCVCHPEVMCALIYALNDADERVRAKAADEIGDQLRRNPCCCSQKVVAALTCALGDCHWGVRFQAKQALKRCGYSVVKARKMGCCELGCCEMGCHGHASGVIGGQEPSPAVPADLPQGEGQAPSAAPTPAPHLDRAPEAPSAYFQKPVIRQTSANISPAKKGLAVLLGLFD